MNTYYMNHIKRLLVEDRLRRPVAVRLVVLRRPVGPVEGDDLPGGPGGRQPSSIIIIIIFIIITSVMLIIISVIVINMMIMFIIIVCLIMNFQQYHYPN